MAREISLLLLGTLLVLALLIVAHPFGPLPRSAGAASADCTAQVHPPAIPAAAPAACGAAPAADETDPLGATGYGP